MVPWLQTGIKTIKYLNYRLGEHGIQLTNRSLECSLQVPYLGFSSGSFSLGPSTKSKLDKNMILKSDILHQYSL